MNDQFANASLGFLYGLLLPTLELARVFAPVPKCWPDGSQLVAESCIDRFLSLGS